MAAPTAVPSGQVALLIRVWLDASGPAGVPSANERNKITWNDATPLVRMLHKVVGLGGGRTVEDPTGLLQAHFASDFAAARTARQIQALITGFASIIGQASSPQVLAASIGLGSTPMVPSLQFYLQQRVQPAQIVIASSRSIPSALTTTLRVRRLEETSPELELHELLWGHKEQAAAAAVQAHTRAAQQRQEAVPTLKTPLPSRSPALIQRLSTSLAHGRDVVADLAALVRRWLRGCRERLLSIEPRALIGSKTLQLSAVGMCVVVATGLLLLHHRSPKAKAAITTPPKPISAMPSATPSATGTAMPPSGPAKVASSASPPSSATGKGRQPPHIEPPQKAEANVAEEKLGKAARAGRGDLSPEQTRQVLSRGQAELDRGCYTRAIGYYRRVLDDDPRNAMANSGIEKARTRKSLSGEDPQAHCQ